LGIGRNPFTLKPIDDKVRVLRSNDGKKALFPVWAFSSKVQRDIRHCIRPLGLDPPVYNEFYPYNADPFLPPDMTNEQAFEAHFEGWKARMQQYGDGSDVPARVHDFFKSLSPFRDGEMGVTTVIEVRTQPKWKFYPFCDLDLRQRLIMRRWQLKRTRMALPALIFRCCASWLPISC